MLKNMCFVVIGIEGSQSEVFINTMHLLLKILPNELNSNDITYITKVNIHPDMFTPCQCVYKGLIDFSAELCVDN